MAKQTFQMHIYAYEEHNYKTGDVSTQFRLIPWARSDGSCAFGMYVGPVEVEAEVPEQFDMRAAKLETLRAEQAKVRAEMSARITEIQRQINELLAIDMEQPA